MKTNPFLFVIIQCNVNEIAVVARNSLDDDDIQYTKSVLYSLP